MEKKINVFCLPFAGGSRYSYNTFKKISSDLNFIQIELPGRGARHKEPLKTNIDAITDDLLSQLDGKLDGPYALFGHSMGALMIYLLAKEIQSRGLPAPIHLFASGSGGPSIKNRITSTYKLPQDKFIEVIKNLGGSSEKVMNDPDMVGLFEPILRADFEAIENYYYTPSDPFNIPITVFFGTEDVKVTFDEAKAWQKESLFDVEVVSLPGKHFFIFDNEKSIVETMNKKMQSLILNKSLN